MAFCVLPGCTGSPGGSQPATFSGPAAKDGDWITAYYRVTLPEGQVFESNFNKTPVGFTIGDGTMIKGFDNAVRGMHQGETKDVDISPELGYGPRMPELVESVPIEMFPANFTPIVGGTLVYEDAAGQTGVLTIVSFNQTHITIDKNHPLAGKLLHFTIKVLQIGNATSS